jgi:aryl-alcohol dehydrogenase-like predicted oxidoreductase
METRSIGKLDASIVGLGCNNFGGRIDEPASERVVHAALDAGITLFDTADIYGGTLSEEYLGRALGGRRDEAIVATKFGGPIDEERKGGASAAYIERAVEDSLRRLGTDRIDLYQLHFPDTATPFEETLGALDQ